LIDLAIFVALGIKAVRSFRPDANPRRFGRRDRVGTYRNLESTMINHPLFVRGKPEPSKEKEVALGSCARRLAKSLMCVSLLLASAAATADNNLPVPTQIVDLANKVDGVHPGFRAFHAKGVVVEGSFKASREAARLSRATLFNGRSIPVTARFSDGSGMPTVPDGSPGMPRGIAIKYHLPGGADTDMVTNSLKFFPVGTGEDFRDLLQAVVASPPDAPKPTKLEQFFASHPNAPKALGTPAIPDSFADEEYHGIDAFIFVSKSGQTQAVRYLVVPEELVHITPEEAAKQSPDFLFDELSTRIAQKPVVFHLKAQLAQPGDQTKDASQPWPADRKVVDLGVLTLTKVVPNSLEAQQKLLFLPTNLTAGIELSDDPLPSVRTAAYAVSFGRRSQSSSASSGPDNSSDHASDAAERLYTLGAQTKHRPL
jgi:catalase